MAIDPNAAPPGGGAFAGLGAAPAPGGAGLGAPELGGAGLGAVDPVAGGGGMAGGPGGEAPPPEVQAAMESVMPILAEATPRIVMAVFEALAGIAGAGGAGTPPPATADPMAAAGPGPGPGPAGPGAPMGPNLG